MGNSSVFDLIGPVMIGPSSSHTAGVVRLGWIAHHILGLMPTQVDIIFYNSFAKTYSGHGSDKAVIAGLMGFSTFDPRIRNSLSLAKQRGMKYHFRPSHNSLNRHPNTLEIRGQHGKDRVHLVGESTGGAKVRVSHVNDFSCNFHHDSPTLLIFAEDKKGSIAQITTLICETNSNIASMTLDRKAKHGEVLMGLVLDQNLPNYVLDQIKALPWVEKIKYLS
ncbi:MAG: L-serine ammonia-lyase, iron-sulfur-dependent subunit beta [Cytophagales bacterium]|nr:L-serine ammonia-lyase, iron-sulfur-dependent subunit beta [Cytophagales bacterium]